MGDAFFPSAPKPRKMAEKAILSAVQETYVHGVSMRKADSVVRALGLDGIDKSEVSRIAKEPDEEVSLSITERLRGLARMYGWTLPI